MRKADLNTMRYYRRQEENKQRRIRTARTVSVIILDIVCMAAAWTICALAPLPYNIIFPVLIGAIRIAVQAVLMYRAHIEPITENKTNVKSKKAAERGAKQKDNNREENRGKQERKRGKAQKSEPKGRE